MPTRFLMGARGWDHDAWHGGLYPADLPVDWRLAFYAGQYRTVLLPWAGMRDLPDAQLADWVRDTGEDFRFVVECAKSAVPAALGRLGRHLGCRLGGVVVAMSPIDDGAAGVVVGCGQPGAEGRADSGRCLLMPVADIRVRAAWLRARLAACRPGERVYVFVGGTPPSLRGLDELAGLAELLGL
jgi:hypothetical protein